MMVWLDNQELLVKSRTKEEELFVGHLPREVGLLRGGVKQTERCSATPRLALSASHRS
jgi:hypothetical protein